MGRKLLIWDGGREAVGESKRTFLGVSMDLRNNHDSKNG